MSQLLNFIAWYLPLPLLFLIYLLKGEKLPEDLTRSSTGGRLALTLNRRTGWGLGIWMTGSTSSGIIFTLSFKMFQWQSTLSVASRRGQLRLPRQSANCEGKRNR